MRIKMSELGALSRVMGAFGRKLHHRRRSLGAIRHDKVARLAGCDEDTARAACILDHRPAAFYGMVARAIRKRIAASPVVAEPGGIINSIDSSCAGN